MGTLGFTDSTNNKTTTDRILIVDDDATLCEYVSELLARRGFQPVVARTVLEMAHYVESTAIDLILLDIELPDGDGIEILREMRNYSDIPIIMMTGSGSASDRIVALELGADDYIKKPVNSRELAARIRNILRRFQSNGQNAPGTDEPCLYFADYCLNVQNRTLQGDGGEVLLTAAEFDLLHALVDARGRLLTRDYLLSTTRGRGWSPDDRSVDVLIANIRRKIESDRGRPRIIKTVRGGGYMIASPVSNTQPEPELFEPRQLPTTDYRRQVAPTSVAG